MADVEVNIATEEKVEKALQEFKPNAAFQSAIALMPKNYKEVMDLATIASRSGMVPKDYANNPNGAAVAIMFGLELGLTPTQALQNIMVVNGRPSLWGDAVLALAIGSGELDEFEEDAPDVALKQGYGRCMAKRKDGTNPVTRVFTLDDAKRAGLMTKSTWQQYPGRMLMMRARSWALRDTVPHVLKGIHVREELADAEVIEIVPLPKRTQMAQEAQIVETGTLTPNEGSNAQSAPQSGPTQGPVETVGDAQEPVTAEEMVSDEDRKEMFKMRVEAKIPIADVKAYLRERFGIEETPKLTKIQAKEFKSWMVKHAR